MQNIGEHINNHAADLLTPENAALLLVDHQTGLSLGVETMTFFPRALPINLTAKTSPQPTQARCPGWNVSTLGAKRGTYTL